MESLVVSVIFLVGIVYIFYFRKKFVVKTENLIFYSDEKTIYTEYPIKCWLKHRNTNKTFMPKSKVEITNYRIIISQKFLFAQKFMLNYVVNYKINKGEEFNRMENVKFKNHMDVSPSDITFESKKDIDIVLIAVPKNNIYSAFEQATISFTTKNIQMVIGILENNSKQKRVNN